MRQKEELRREKEAARLKAANERATARKIARESMELIEDERLELMELAASSKELTSIVSLDSATLQHLDLFRGTFNFMCSLEHCNLWHMEFGSSIDRYTINSREPWIIHQWEGSLHHLETCLE